MPQPNEINPVVESLRKLAPATTAISRDRLLFEAGRASALSRWAWMWKAGTLLFFGTTVGLAYLLLTWEPQTVFVEKERIVETPSAGVSAQEPALPSRDSQLTPPASARFEERTPPGADASEKLAMWKLRNEVLRWGPEMLPPSGSTSNLNPAQAKELERWLDLPGGTFTTPTRIVPKKSRREE